MVYSTRRRQRHYLRLLIISALVLGAVGVVVVYKFMHHGSYDHMPMIPISQSPAKPSAQPYSSATASYLFSGTVTMARAVDTFANGNYEQPFSGMATLGTFDAHIADLECPITTNTVPYEVQVQKLIFNCSPNYLPALKEHFPIINLSSNHQNDQGPGGYTETVKRLTDAGIQTVGNYSPHAEPDDCKAIIFPVRLQQSNNQTTTTNLPLAVCSYNYKIIFSPNPGELESIQKWSKVMPVIGLMNGGPEYQHTAGQAQIDVAHKMVDYGSAFVVGDGAHWAQNSEVYKGKMIIYSLGNFIFDQTDYDGRLAFNLVVNMKLNYDQNLADWIQLGKDCRGDTTNCFSLAQSRNLKLLQPQFTFSDVVSHGGYQAITSKANATDAAYIEGRANWPQTLKQLGQTN